MVTENLNQVRKNIQEACKAVGRDPKEVTLIAVSKTKPVSMLQEAYDAGARVFGENKVQEITDKYPQLPDDIQWHSMMSVFRSFWKSMSHRRKQNLVSKPKKSFH